MDDIKITLSKDHLDNQTQRLVDELGYTQQKAQSIYDQLHSNIRQELETREDDWTDETINAFTNILISTQIQTKEQVTGEIPDEFDVFKNIAAQV